MTPLDNEPKIVGMANSLRISGPRLVEGICRFCHDRIQKRLRKYPGVSGIRELQDVVCRDLNLRVHEIWSDEDLGAVVHEYVHDGDPVFAILPNDLAPDTTFGVLIQRSHRDTSGRSRWAAIVDCRGAKALRRFFTLWHEIAHCLTAVDQYELPLQHRTSIRATAKDPVEKITDMVAGDIAFFPVLFLPILDREIKETGRLTFDGVERVRGAYCSDASRHSALIACVNQCPLPTMWIHAELGYKKSEIQAMQSPQGELLPTAAPKPVLRVTDSLRNDAVRDLNVLIPVKMRVPESSVISKAFQEGGIWVAQEDLSTWESQGEALPSFPIHVEASGGPSGVSALITALTRL
jgi:hypothetical protein